MLNARLTVTAAGRIASVLLLLILAAPLSLGALAAQPTAGAEITGVVWQWQLTITDTQIFAPDDSSRYTIELLPDARVSVQADCNRGAGGYAISGNQLAIGPLASTLVGCPPGSLSDEFLRQLDDTGAFATDGERLYLSLASAPAVMVFVKAAPARTAVTGSITYRERIALPPDAVVRVQIQDTSRADAPAIVLGEQVIEAAGRQVPIPFAVTYDAAQVTPNGRYTLRVRIESADGQLLWTNTQAYPVITGGNPTSDIEVIVQSVG